MVSADDNRSLPQLGIDAILGCDMRVFITIYLRWAVSFATCHRVQYGLISLLYAGSALQLLDKQLMSHVVALAYLMLALRR